MQMHLHYPSTYHCLMFHFSWSYNFCSKYIPIQFSNIVWIVSPFLGTSIDTWGRMSGKLCLQGNNLKEEVFLLLEIGQSTMNSPMKHWHVTMVSRWWHTKSSWHIQEIQLKGLTKQASNDLFAKHDGGLLSKPIQKAWNGPQMITLTAPNWFESISGVLDPFRGLF